MNKHSFFKYCIDPTVFDNCTTLREFLQQLKKQSNDDKAKVPYREDLKANQTEDDDLKTIKAPRYFGAGVEALAEVFFETFGLSDYNLGNYLSQDTIEEDLEDIGYDATAITAKEKKYGKVIEKLVPAMSPVYIQVKGVLNPTKEHTTRDGSYISNFIMASVMDAMSKGQCYSARYVLFTTGKGVHYKLDNNSKKCLEVVGYQKISKKIDNNIIFWNEFRDKIGLPALSIIGHKDVEWETMNKKVDKLKESL
jgi:hypothetical protein